MNVKWISFVVWIVSILVFAIAQFFAPLDYASIINNSWGKVIGTTVVVGILAFVTTLVFIIIDKRRPHKIPVKIIRDRFMRLLKYPATFIVAIFALLLLATAVLGAKYIVQNTKVKSLLTAKTPSPIATPDPSEVLSDNNIFNKINDYRQNKSLATFNQDSESCEIAKTILENNFWNTNYNVNNYKTQCPSCFELSIAQAKDVISSSSVVSSWEANEKTLETLKNSGKNACVSIKDGKVVFVVAKKNTATAKKITNTTGSIDPIINCNINANCGGGTRQMKQSECSQSICCQIGGSWSMYPSKTICTQAQNNYYSVKAGGSANNYPPCTVYYPLLGYSQTYTYISPSQCQSWQATANSYNTAPTTVYVPTPTQDPAYQDLLNQHAEACKQAVAEWNTQKEQFYATEYNNFSSSYEAVQELERRRQIYQQDLYSAGCTQTISI